MIKNQRSVGQRGFTLVELAVVVTVIAILAIIGYIAYGGAQDRAREAVLRSDLTAAAEILNVDNVRNGGKGFPEDMASADNNNGLPASIDTTYQYRANNSVDPPTFCLSGINGMIAMHITEEGVVNQGVCDGDNGPVAGGGEDNGSSNPPSVGFSEISFRANHACGISLAGKLYCWGSNKHGQVGNNSLVNVTTPVDVDDSGLLVGRTVTDVAVGGSHTCAVADGSVYCWGWEANGQLGNGSSGGDRLTPVAVSTSGVLSGKTISSITAGVDANIIDGGSSLPGGSHTCAIADGKAYCWGKNQYGQLGNGSVADSTTPVAVSTSGVLSGKTVTAISAGNSSTCAIANGSAYCWGMNSSGQLGTGSTTNSTTPVAVSTSGVLSGKTVTAISAGPLNTCAVADQKAYCWGDNAQSQLGNNSTAGSLLPIAVDATGSLLGKSVASIAAGDLSACAIAEGHAYCWGWGAGNRLGNGTTSSQTVPGPVSQGEIPAGESVSKLVGGDRAARCVLATNNEVYCVGWSGYGRLGNGSSSSYNGVPKIVLHGEIEG